MLYMGGNGMFFVVRSKACKKIRSLAYGVLYFKLNVVRGRQRHVLCFEEQGL
jgi:hypothetical protein